MVFTLKTIAFSAFIPVAFCVSLHVFQKFKSSFLFGNPGVFKLDLFRLPF